MLKKYLGFLIIFYITCLSFSYGYESRYSTSLSRMEREWLHREFTEDNDETRMSRLEEKVFGTIHDIDTKSRYKHLQQAFDAKKTMRYKRRNNLYDYPTSLPMNVDELLGNW